MGDKIKILFYQNKKRLLGIFIVLLLFFINFNIAYNLGKSSAQNIVDENFFPQNEEFAKYNQLFKEIWEIIKNNFVDQSKVDPDKAGFGALRGLVKSLNDPYSDLFTPTQSKLLHEDLSGKFCGVGMEIGIRNNVLIVIAPLEGTPAQKAGLKAGDLILKVNNEDTSNMSLEEAVSKIRGKCGEKVILTIFREGWSTERDFEVIRAEIKIESIKYKLIPPNIGYIKIVNFGLTTIPDFLKAYNELFLKGAKKFILDVRDNPGGYLHVALRFSELFLPRGKIILQEVWGKEQDKKIIRSSGPGFLSKVKMIVLVNRGSASAAEIFAGALRDNLKIKLIGEKTFGKGSVQQIFEVGGKKINRENPEIEKSYTLKLTVAYWLTPKGLKLEDNGIEPDIKVVDKNLEDDKDEVLEEAIKILGKL